jgi:hypothetical protein
MFQLFAKSHHPRASAIDAVRAALDAAGARLVAVRPYTTQATQAVVAEVSVPAEGWVFFLATMTRPWDGFELDLWPDADAAPPVPEAGAIVGTLHLTLMHAAAEPWEPAEDDPAAPPVLPGPPAPASARGARRASPR